MAETLKILGQSAPANTSNADLYTVPSATSAVVSTIAIVNTSTAGSTYRMFIVPSGGSAGVSNALAYDIPISGSSLTTLTLGITLSAGAKIIVRTSTANSLTFHAWGSEVA
jgi:hypothetical protein